MADPQKLKKLVSEAVSSRVEEMQKSLIEEITASLQEAVEAAGEKAEEAADKKVQAAVEKAEAAEERANKAQEARKEAEAALKEAEAALKAAEKDLKEKDKKGKKNEETAGGSPTDLLGAAVASISDASSQADILRALLDGIGQFAARSALFVVKGGQLNGWQARGFDDEGAVKGLQIDPGDGLAARALQDKEPVSAAAAEFNQKFISKHGNPVDGNATVLPLVVREKVSAVIYVDAGTEAPGRADVSAAKVLAQSAAMWLEILALRKIAGGAAADEAPAATASAAATAPAPVEEEQPAPLVEKASAAAAPVSAPPPSAPASGGPDLSGLSAADQETHKKAKRFAKLLVDEIKLYNQAKVAEGKKNKDLYPRLKEDIDKSRQTYEKRWGSSAAASGNYFHAELVRILADGDASLLGE